MKTDTGAVRTEAGKTADAGAGAVPGEAKQPRRGRERRPASADKLAEVRDLLDGAGGDAGAGKGADKGAAGDAGKGADKGAGEDAGAGEGEDKDAGGEAGSGEDKGAGEDAGAGGKKAAPRTWKEVAAALDMDPADLYAVELELAGDGGKVSLGAVKDLLQVHGAALPEISGLLATTRKAATEAEDLRDASNAEAAVIRRDLSGVIAAMGKVPAGVMEAVRGAQLRRMERETMLTLDAAPEWRNAKTFETDRREIAAMLGKYGLSRAESDMIDDSRIMLFLRDIIRSRRGAQKALKDAGESGDDVRTTNAAPAGRGSLSQTQAAAHRARIASAKAGGRESKVAAVAALLKGK